MMDVGTLKHLTFGRIIEMINEWIKILWGLDVSLRLGEIAQNSVMPENVKKYNWTYNQVYNQVYSQEHAKISSKKVLRAFRYIGILGALGYGCVRFAETYGPNDLNGKAPGYLFVMALFTFFVFMRWLNIGSRENKLIRMNADAAAHEIAGAEAAKYATINEGMYQAAVQRLG